MKNCILSLVLVLSLSLLLSACGDSAVDASYPQRAKDERREKYGKLGGEEGLLVLGGPNENDGGGNSPIGVNSFLWRATLDTLAFMPLVSADPFGGVIITDWYEDPATPGERFKATVLILDRTLRADGVKVSLFKQQKDASGGWRDTAVNPSTARDLENTILTRARQLRINQPG